jgi:hypothetical protein
MSNQVQCTTQIPEAEGLENNVLTVGRHFFLNCEGSAESWDRAFDFSKAFVILDENNKNSIKVFKVEARNANSFDVDLTLYVAGDIQTSNFKISDGNHEIDLGPQNFKIKTVIEQKTEKPPEPFGFIVSRLNWPWQYSALAFVLVCAFILTVVGLILYKMKWRGRLERLKNFDSTIAADSQFYKEIRKIEKKDYPSSELEKIFKTYLLRTYRVPAFELSNRQIISFIKSKYPRLKNERRQIFNLLKDIDILKKSSDLEKRKKFLDQCYRLVDHVEALKLKGLL